MIKDKEDLLRELSNEQDEELLSELLSFYKAIKVALQSVDVDIDEVNSNKK